MKTVKEINPHFEDFLFDWKHKTYLLVGGYGSSKSYHIALKVLLKLLEEKRTALVVREVFDTIRDSTYSLFLEIIEDMGLVDIIRPTVSPMTFNFLNGSKIIFKGMDKPKKLKSINDITIIWIEEAAEVKYAGYKELLGRARHPNLSLHFILSTNPVAKNNWVYTHFFKDEQDEELYEKKCIVRNDTYYHHSTAEDNLFLPDSYIEQLDEMKEYDPDLYRVARTGRFGVNGIRVLPQFEVMSHDEVMAHIKDIPKRFHRIGMDFGFITSYNALIKMAIDDKNKALYIYFEYYDKGKTDDITVEEIRPFIDKSDLIIADSAEPKTIAYYNQSGLRMVAVHKDTRLNAIKKVKRFKKIYCSDMCKNTIYELETLTYAKDKNDNLIEDEFTIDAHTFDAIKYGLDGYEVADLKEKKNYSGKGAVL